MMELQPDWVEASYGSVELRIQACLNYDPLREAAMVGRIFTYILLRSIQCKLKFV